MLTFFDFGAAAAASDVTIAVQDFTPPTATGNQDITSTAIAGLTPKAAIVFANGHITTNSPGETARGQINFGIVTSSASRVQVHEQDNTASMVSQHRYSRSGSALTIADWSGGTVSAVRKEADGSLISGGVRLNYATANAEANYRGAIVAFAGNDVSAYMEWKNFAVAATQTVTCGFAADLVLLITANSAAESSTDMSYSFGAATSDGTQYCVAGWEKSAIANQTPFQAIVTNKAGLDFNKSTDGALGGTYTINNFTGTSFDIVRSATAGNDVTALALKFTGGDASIVPITTPTSTGSWAITGAGFTPQFALLFITNLEAVDPTFPLTSDDTHDGLGVCVIGDEQWSFSFRVNSGSATADVGEQNGNVAIMGASATDTNAIEGTLTSFDSDGMTLNLSATQGTGKKGFAVFIK